MDEASVRYTVKRKELSLKYVYTEKFIDVRASWHAFLRACVLRAWLIIRQIRLTGYSQSTTCFNKVDDLTGHTVTFDVSNGYFLPYFADGEYQEDPCDPMCVPWGSYLGSVGRGNVGMPYSP